MGTSKVEIITPIKLEFLGSEACNLLFPVTAKLLPVHFDLVLTLSAQLDNFKIVAK